MEPNFKSRSLSNHRSAFNFCLSVGLVLTNAVLNFIVLAVVKFNLMLYLGIIFGFFTLYLHYVCSYAFLIQSNYLGRDELITKDYIYSCCVLIHYVKKHLIKFKLGSIVLSTIYCFYIIIIIYALLMGSLKNEDFALLCVFTVCNLLVMGEPCYRRFIWLVILKLSCSKRIVVAPNQEQQVENAAQNQVLQADGNPQVQLRELNNFFGTLYAVNVYRNFYPPFYDNDLISGSSNRRESNPSSSKSEEYYKIIDYKNVTTQECIICFDSFGPEKECVELKCNSMHVFHKDCIHEWTKHNTNCPICRKKLIKRRLGRSDSDSDSNLSIPRLMLIHQMPRIHQGDDEVSSEEEDNRRSDFIFDRLLNRQPRPFDSWQPNELERGENRLENEVQEVRNRLNDIVSRLREIQEEVRQRPHIIDYMYNGSNGDESLNNSSFSEFTIHNPGILNAISEESKENNENEENRHSFRSVISPNLPEFMQDEY